MMLSSGDRQEDAKRCRELGVSAYLTKPLKQSDLLNGIVAVLGSQTSGTTRSEPKPILRSLASRALNILLAEDNVVNQRLAVRLLEKRGHHVTLASNGRIALELFKGHTFDLILMDIQMPEMDGFEATTAIRAIEASQGGHIPIVAMTAHAMKGDRERCIDGGMDAYVPKPLQINQLIEVIEDLGRPSESDAPEGANMAEQQEGFDLSVALAQVEGDRELLGEMIDIFFSDTPAMVAQIEQGLSAGDAVVVQKAAHKIKGSVLSLGAPAAAESALALEMAGRAGDVATAAIEFERLKGVIEKLNATLASVKSTHLAG